MSKPRPDLTPTETEVLLAIGRLLKNEDKVTRATISDESYVSLSGVGRAINMLYRLGYIERVDNKIRIKEVVVVE